MTEETETDREALVLTGPDTAPPEPAARPTRPYMAQVFGKTFAIDADSRDAAIAHLVRRLRKEVSLRVAEFEDGATCALEGIPLEVASTGDVLPFGETL